eukprot:Clim_evm11s11 gene=Clim_evmTU11s11
MEGKVCTGRVRKWIRRLGQGFIEPDDKGLVDANNGQHVSFKYNDLVEPIDNPKTPIPIGSYVEFTVGCEPADLARYTRRYYNATKISILEVRRPEDYGPKKGISLSQGYDVQFFATYDDSSLLEHGAETNNAPPLAGMIDGSDSAVDLEIPVSSFANRKVSDWKVFGECRVGATFATDTIRLLCEWAQRRILGTALLVQFLQYGTLFSTDDGGNCIHINLVRIEDLVFPHPEVKYSLASELDACPDVILERKALAGFRSYVHSKIEEWVRELQINVLGQCSSAFVLVMVPFDYGASSKIGPILWNASSVLVRNLLDLGITAKLVQPIHDQHTSRERDVAIHEAFSLEYSLTIALETLRCLHQVNKPILKVMILDCDNTMWKGACGEVSPSELDFQECHKAIQQRAVRFVQDEGGLVALCSRNSKTSDVIDVFEQRKSSGMILNWDDVTTYRINHDRKSTNVNNILNELNLSASGAVFVDDNPMEGEEVSSIFQNLGMTSFAFTTEMTTAFIDSCWCFDQRHSEAKSISRGAATGTKRRADQYADERKRRELLRQNQGDLSAFFQNLGLRITIAAPEPADLPRMASLTDRTNQFNACKDPRTEVEMKMRVTVEEAEGRAITRIVHVSDRFGYYGLVGLLSVMPDPLDHRYAVTDIFLMSCRVLHRGVEHLMIRTMAEAAEGFKRTGLLIRWRSTERNVPIRRFLASLTAVRWIKDRDHPDTSVDITEAAFAYLTVEDALRVEFRPDSTTESFGDHKDVTIDGSVHLPQNVEPSYAHPGYMNMTSKEWSLNGATYRFLAQAAIDPTVQRSLSAIVAQDLSSVLPRAAGDENLSLEAFRRKARHKEKLQLHGIARSPGSDVVHGKLAEDHEGYIAPAPPPGSTDKYI